MYLFNFQLFWLGFGIFHILISWSRWAAMLGGNSIQPGGTCNVLFYGDTPCLMGFPNWNEGHPGFMCAGWSPFREGMTFVTIWNAEVVTEFFFKVKIIPLPSCLPIPVGIHWHPRAAFLCLAKAQGENSKCLSRCSSTQSHSADPGGKTRVKGWKDLMYLGARQSEKELGKSLYKLRSTRLVILQNVEQLGFTRLQLWDTAWQEQVPNPWGDLGQLGLLSLPRHIQT